MIFWENLMLAFSAIRANKLRSFLTMLGMIIGISSVITIVSLGDTMRGLMASEYENIGLGAVVLYITPENTYYTESEMFSTYDRDRVREAMGDALLYAGFRSSVRGDIKNGRRKETVYLNGMAENPTALEDLSILHGRMFTDADIRNRRHYIILEKETAVNLFGSADAVGQNLKAPIKNEEEDFLVIGVYENTDSVLMRLMSGTGPSTSYIPESLLVSNDDWNWQLYLVGAEDANPEMMKASLLSFISRMKNVPIQSVLYYSAQDEMVMVDTILMSMSMIVGAIAAISLLVGGIGIMNIMLVSVTERTREIGIRKALGAQTADIMIQFLIESAIIAGLGGLIGTIYGLSLVSVGAVLLGMSVVVKPVTVVISVTFSAAVGVFFGLYPASKAAKADPVVALRYE